VDNQENFTEAKFYEKVIPEDATKIISEVNREVTDLEKGDLHKLFFTGQLPIVLENSGKIDPELMQFYITADDYQAL
jgi:bidirectional [NiFe] hydrogenase diaphorase subunit